MAAMKNGGRKLRAAVLGCVLAGASACASVEAGGVNGAMKTPLLVNVMPDLRAYQAAASGRGETEQVALLKSLVIERHPDLYGSVLPAPNDAALAAYARRLPTLSGEMARLEPDLIRAIVEGAGKLNRQAGSPPLPPIYLMPSFFGFDGMARPTENGSVVMFGLDAIAANHSGEAAPDVRPLVSHELFHAQHYAANPSLHSAARAFFAGEPQELHGFVWFEGLATCASRRDNPGSSEEDILLSKTLAALPPPVIRRVAGELLAKLDSRSMADAARYLLLTGGKNDIPDRTGYLVGMFLADDALTRMSMAQAMRLNGPALRAEVKRALERIASGERRPSIAAACRTER